MGPRNSPVPPSPGSARAPAPRFSAGLPPSRPFFLSSDIMRGPLLSPLIPGAPQSPQGTTLFPPTLITLATSWLVFGLCLSFLPRLIPMFSTKSEPQDE